MAGRVRRAMAILSATVVALALSASCAKNAPAAKSAQALAAAPIPAPPPPLAVTLLPAEVARAALVATMVAPTLNGALDTGLALVRQATPLPLDAGAVREMALGELGIPPEVSAQLDLSAPVSAAVVAFGHEEAAKAAFTFAVKAGTDVPKFLGSLGTVTGRRGPVLLIHTPRNGDGWFLPKGNVIVFADSEVALSQAANLALEARRAVKDDVSVVLYPDGMARAARTDVKTALDRFLALMDERAQTSGNNMGLEGREQLRDLLAYAADTTTAEVALHLDVKKGITLLARLRAKPGSRLESVSRNVQAATIDPLLVEKTDSGVVVTSAYPDRTLDQLRRQRTRLPAPKNPGKDVVAAGKLMDALIEGLAGTLSAVGRFQPLSFAAVYPIKDAAAAAKIEAALLAADRAALTAMLRPEVTGAAMDVKVKQARIVSIGKHRAVFWNLAFTLANDPIGVMKKLFGPHGIEMYAAVVNGDRLAITMGQTAKARLTAILAGKTEAPKGDLAEAMALAGGRTLFYYFDLREALSLVGTLGGKDVDPRLKMMTGLLKVAIPITGGVVGDAQGRVVTLDMTLPPSCIAGIGGLVGGLMAGGGGAAPSPTAPRGALRAPQ